MLVVLTSRLAQVLEWLKNVAGYRILESNWELLDRSVYNNPETWLTGSQSQSQFRHQTTDAIVEIFPRLAQWLKADSHHSFLWLPSFNASGKEDLHRALSEADGNEDLCVMGIFFGHTKSLSCRATDQLPKISSDSLLPRYKSYLLRKTAQPTVGQGLHKPLVSTERQSRTLYLSRHGESEFNVLGKVGGDANLSPRGERYAACLGEYVNRTLVGRKGCGSGFHVWTSTLRRTIQTARWIQAPQERFAQLNELGSGICDGMTYEEIAARFPVEFAARDADKFRYRYPEGESYADLLQRVQPVLQRLQDEDNLLIVAHQAVIRCLLASLLGKDDQELPYINTPLHTIMQVTFSPAHPEGHLEMIPLSVECVDTHRARPKNVSVDRTVEEALVTVPAHFSNINLFTEPEKANVDISF